MEAFVSHDIFNNSCCSQLDIVLSDCKSLDKTNSDLVDWRWKLYPDLPKIICDQMKYLTFLKKIVDFKRFTLSKKTVVKLPSVFGDYILHSACRFTW